MREGSGSHISMHECVKLFDRSVERGCTLQVAPEHLEAAREAAEKLPAIDISEVDLQWVQVQSLL